MSSTAVFDTLSFVEDLNPFKDTWNMKAKVIRKWKSPYKMELILLDEQGSRIQASIKKPLIPFYENEVFEDDVLILCKFHVSQNKDHSTVIKHQYKLIFSRIRTHTRVSGWGGVHYGIDLISFSDILRRDGCKALHLFTIDVAGSAIWCGNLDIFGRHPNQTKRICLGLQDLEGVILRCILWNDYAQIFHDFISCHNSNDHIMIVIQHANIKKFHGKLTVQNHPHATRLFINEDIAELDTLSFSLIQKHGAEYCATSRKILTCQRSRVHNYRRSTSNTADDNGFDTLLSKSKKIRTI